MSGNAKDDDNGGYLHRGIARRGFERRFSLTDHMKVTGASLDNGLLCVDVVRDVPEAAKPRTIKIGTAVETVRPQVTEHKGGPIGTSNGNRPKSQKRPRNLGAFCHWRRTLGPTYR
jgi:hypothetical protein